MTSGAVLRAEVIDRATRADMPENISFELTVFRRTEPMPFAVTLA